ncbi:MAG: sugar ABC transporter substrate-binding protein [Spirochaetales bacterium]|nr:sugar ABC transporter substrate-binding protein [Spirochaetales bacterium]
MRKFAWTAALFLVVTALFANGSGDSDEELTLRYASFSAGENNAAVLEQMIAAYEEAHPGVVIENENAGFDDHFTQLVTKIASGDAPDAFELNMENFLAYAIRGAVKPLGDIAEQAGIPLSETYAPGVLESCSYAGEAHAIPLMFSTVLSIYNKQLFDEAGLAYPTQDWTWSDAQAAAEKIAQPENDLWGIYTPLQFWEFYKVTQQNGGGLMTSDGSQFTIDSPENLETLKFMVSRIQDSHVMPSDTELAGRGDWDLFVDGRVAMIHTGVWAFTEFAERCDFPWAVEVEPGNTRKATHFFANVGCVSRDTEHSVEALEFLHFLASDPSSVTARLEAQWELPTVNDPSVLERYLAQTPPENKIAVFNSLDYAVRPPALEQYQELVEIVNPKLEMVRLGLMSPEEALRTAQAEAEARIQL